MNSECWPVRRCENNTRANVFARLIIRMKKYRVQGYVFPVEYLQNGERYSSSVLTIGKAKNHATSWYKRRLCSRYRSRDIEVSNISIFECWPIRAL